MGDGKRPLLVWEGKENQRFARLSGIRSGEGREDPRSLQKKDGPGTKEAGPTPLLYPEEGGSFAIRTFEKRGCPTGEGGWQKALSRKIPFRRKKEYNFAWRKREERSSRRWKERVMARSRSHSGRGRKTRAHQTNGKEGERALCPGKGESREGDIVQRSTFNRRGKEKREGKSALGELKGGNEIPDASCNLFFCHGERGGSPRKGGFWTRVKPRHFFCTRETTSRPSAGGGRGLFV